VRQRGARGLALPPAGARWRSMTRPHGVESVTLICDIQFRQITALPFLSLRAQRRAKISRQCILLIHRHNNKNSAIAEGPRDASCQLKSCHMPRNSAETTCTTSPEQIEVMTLEGYSGAMCNKHVHSTMTRSSRFHCPIGVINKPTTDELWISPVYRRLGVAKFSESTI